MVPDGELHVKNNVADIVYTLSLGVMIGLLNVGLIVNVFDVNVADLKQESFSAYNCR